MKYLCVLVIVLILALIAVLPQCAEGSEGAVSGESISESFFITIDPVGDHYSGDLIRLRGSTNLPPTDALLVQVYSSSYHPGRHGPFYGISQNVTIFPGGTGTGNRWSIDVATHNWSQDEYLVAVKSEPETHGGFYASQLFNLFEADKRPAVIPLTVATLIPPLTVSTTTQITPATTIPTRPAPISIMVTLTAFGALLIVSGIRKRKM